MKIGSTLAFVSLLALGGAMLVTNPSEDAYAEHLAETLNIEAQSALCDPEGFADWLGKVGEALSGACQEVIAGGGRLTADEIQATILDNTQRQNRYLFSTYKTELPLQTYEAVGVFGRFFPNPLGEKNDENAAN